MAFVTDSCRKLSLCLFISKTVTFLIVAQTSISKGLIQDQYVGCFNDNGAENAGFSLVGAHTTENCIEGCNTTYAAIKTDNSCRCLEDYGTQLPDSSCASTCSGNNYGYCGAQLNAYVLYTVCPIGNFGAACDKGCHCKREFPCNRTTGNCPGGCEGNWSGPSCNITTVSRQYIGCYSDIVGNRALENCVYCDGAGNDNNNNTFESCSQSCAERNYSYAGTAFYFQCWCGENYSKYGPLDESRCNTLCSGNKNETCGGVEALSVYSVCPVGNYGRSCVGRCHCLNSERCIYRNGSCPSYRCKGGWTGASCSKRDCSLRNGDCYPDEACSYLSLKDANISLCRCPNGFHRNKIWKNCTDIDECANMTCEIQSTTCSNTVGSYVCTCRKGFTTYNATLCIDIDECEENTDDCDQASTICSHTQGSYSCTCRQWFTAFNATSCIGEDVNSKTIASAVVGFIIGIAVTVATGVAILLVYRNRHRIFRRKNNKLKVIASQTEGEPSSSQADENQQPTVEFTSTRQQAPDGSDGYASLAAVNNENTIYTCLQ